MKFDTSQVSRLAPAIFSSSLIAHTPNRFAHDSFLAVALAALLFITSPQSAAQTALDDYIAKEDLSYDFSLDSTIAGPGVTGYNIDLTSQTWRDSTEVSHNLWQHKMTIMQPDGVPTNTAILFINGGRNSDSFPDPLSEEFQVAAGASLLTNSVVVNLPTVPNQPLQFAGETSPRTEDEIIAKTFANFLAGGDDEWPLLLPMVKSAVRAMDATQAHMASLDEPIQIDKFFVFGGSKRGWTTWLTAAVDNRVSAIAPGVIDFLNIDESMQHHRRVYATGPEPPVNCASINDPTGCTLVGGFSLAVGDYVLEGVMDQLAPLPGQELSPRVQELFDIIDPYEYRDRLDMPKYIVNSTGDQFFAPDSSQFYFDDLSGQKYLRYIPNTDHGLDASTIEGALLFHSLLELELPLPEFSWEVSADGTSITVTTESSEPIRVLLWEATNPINRDFREATFGANWISSELLKQEPGNDTYVASRSAPATGATAYMIELEYDFGGKSLKFTTDISVVQVSEPISGMLLPAGMVGMLATLHSGIGGHPHLQSWSKSAN
jgi:PhoPQ-activated pathogenicity-related protein